MKIEEMISAVQKKLGVQVDGRAGPETWGAIYAQIVKPTVGGIPPGEAIEAVDDRSEQNIATLLPEVQPMARALVQRAAFNGIRIKIISGLRTYAEQNELYAQGRTNPDRRSPMPAADTRITISESPSTSGSSRGRNTLRNPSSTGLLVFWAQTWG